MGFKGFNWKLILLSLTTGWLLYSPAVLAVTPNKEYNYQSFDSKIYIKSDSTLEVEEYITYQFKGNFHVAWREIPLDKIDSIDNISVYDVDTGTGLIYRADRLTGTDEDVGYYTYLTSGNKQIIEWYYNLTNTQHTWLIKYRVHGAIQFNNQADRLYWNVFTNFSQSVNNARVEVKLPQIIPIGQINLASYRSSAQTIQQSYDSATGTFRFTGGSFWPQESFTIDCDWPKGLVSPTAYWYGWLIKNWSYILSIIIIILAIAASYLRWLITEKWAKGRGTIIPQYEPPTGFNPATTQIVLKESLTDRGIAATIIDLAIRGYLKIYEDDPALAANKILGTLIFKANPLKLARWFLLAGLIIIFGIIFAPLLIISTSLYASLVPLIIIGLVVIFFLWSKVKKIAEKNFTVCIKPEIGRPILT